MEQTTQENSKENSPEVENGQEDRKQMDESDIAMKEFASSTPKPDYPYSSDSENSEDGLEIVIETPTKKRKRSPKQKFLEMDEKEMKLIEQVDDGLIDQSIEETAAKSKLSTVNIKQILKKVVSNEHVLALVKQVENPEAAEDVPTIFEPKLTRAKAKELFINTQPIPPLPWTAPTIIPPSSEVQVLINEDLSEESDEDDEYIPDAEEVLILMMFCFL